MILDDKLYAMRSLFEVVIADATDDVDCSLSTIQQRSRDIEDYFDELGWLAPHVYRFADWYMRRYIDTMASGHPTDWTFDNYDRHVEVLEAQIESNFNWDGLTEDCKANAIEMLGYYRTGNKDYFSEIVTETTVNGIAFLGTVFAVFPSSKYWVFWAHSNMTQREMDWDSRFAEALSNVASAHGGWIESGMGDPCDIFFGIQFDQEDLND